MQSMSTRFCYTRNGTPRRSRRQHQDSAVDYAEPGKGCDVAEKAVPIGIRRLILRHFRLSMVRFDSILFTAVPARTDHRETVTSSAVLSVCNDRFNDDLLVLGWESLEHLQRCRADIS